MEISEKNCTPPPRWRVGENVSKLRGLQTFHMVPSYELLGKSRYLANDSLAHAMCVSFRIPDQLVSESGLEMPRQHSHVDPYAALKKTGLKSKRTIALLLHLRIR